MGMIRGLSAQTALIWNIVMLFGGALLVATQSCTVSRIPRYEYTSSTQEVTLIYGWKIEAEPHLQSVNLAGESDGRTDSDATRQFLVYATKWVDSLRVSLAKDDHFKFYDNPPVGGVIHLVIYGQLNPAGSLQSTRPTRYNNEPVTAAQRTGVLHDEPMFGAIETLTRVDSVNVTLLNAERRSVGQIRMARADSRRGVSDELSASRVAAVIKRVVNGEQ